MSRVSEPANPPCTGVTHQPVLHPPNLLWDSRCPQNPDEQDVGAPVLETLYGISELPGAPVGAGEPTVPMTAAVLDIADTEAGEVLIGEDGEREDNSGRAVNGAGAGGGGEKLAKEEAREERNEPLPDPVA